jgi:DNA-binding CsgD family transcriptional regulator
MHVVQTQPPSNRAWVFPRSLLAIMVAGAALDAVVLLLRDVHEQPGLGVAFLLVIPITLVSGLTGPIAGTAFAVATVVAMVLHGDLLGIDLPLGGYVVRAAVLLSLPWLVWWVRGGVRAGREPTILGGGARPVASEVLTPREMEVVRLVALGHTNSEIAEQLYISVRTVESHRARAQRKLGLRGRHQLVRYALDEGLIGDAEAH